MNESITSGESEFETSGFFDVRDCPPWDTWVWRLESSSPDDVTLISWVPEHLEAIVTKGIAVNPYECIQWFIDEPARRLSEPIRALIRAGVR